MLDLFTGSILLLPTALFVCARGAIPLPKVSYTYVHAYYAMFAQSEHPPRSFLLFSLTSSFHDSHHSLIIITQGKKYQKPSAEIMYITSRHAAHAYQYRLN